MLGHLREQIADGNSTPRSAGNGMLGLLWDFFAFSFVDLMFVSAFVEKSVAGSLPDVAGLFFSEYVETIIEHYILDWYTIVAVSSHLWQQPLCWHCAGWLHEHR